AAVVRDVHVSHDPVVVADHGFARVLHRPAADRAVLANGVAVADREARRLARVFLVLRIVADGGELVDAIVPADHRRTLDHDVSGDPRAAADAHVVADDRVGADLDVLGQLCRSGHDGSRVNPHDAAPGAQAIFAVTATAAPTRASQS